MTYKSRLTLLILLDSCIVLFAIFVAYWLVYPSSTTPYDYFVIAMTGLSLLLFHHLYAFLY
ncbi:MAG TPA: hypothetical protein VK029_07945, partial [Pseudogracilibacillus sp.]|nr:hypothetical protein [Pseudogracilibacillus sp.]